MSKRRNVILSVLTRVVVCAVLLAIGVGVFVALVATREAPAAADEAARLTHVPALQVQRVPVRRQFQGFGTAEAFRAVNVPAQVRGVVEHLPDDIVAGNRVTRGQVLVQLDDSDYQREVEIRSEQLADIEAQMERLDVERRAALLRLELAEQEVNLAEADLERVLQAQQTSGATQREVDQQRQLLAARQREEIAIAEALESIDPRRDQLRAARSQAESALRLAMRNLQRTTIVSPIEGSLQSVEVDLGESVQADTTIARVVDLNRIDVPIRLQSSARPHIAVGSEVILLPATTDDLQWNARIARIAPEDDQASRTVTAYVQLNQDPLAMGEQALLFPGQFVRARVNSEAEEMRQVIPRRALLADRVRLIEQGVVRSQRVEVAYSVRMSLPRLGIPDEHWLVLRDELPEGSLIVLDAARRLADGTRVQAVEPSGAPSQQVGGEGGMP